MSKKIELKLKKEVISNLQKKQITGGRRPELIDAHTDTAFTCPTYDYTCNSFINECVWSQGPIDYTNFC